MRAGPCNERAPRDDRTEIGDGRWRAPAAERNQGAILAALQRVLPPAGLVLEIASGTGQHVAHFAAALPKLNGSRARPIRRFTVDPRLDRSRGADQCAPTARVRRAPPLAGPARRRGALHQHDPHRAVGGDAGADRRRGDVLPPGGVLFLYGPFRRDGRHTAASNVAFDAQLRGTDPDWGVRDLEAVAALAEAAGFGMKEVVEMPANNLSVVFGKQSSS